MRAPDPSAPAVAGHLPAAPQQTRRWRVRGVSDTVGRTAMNRRDEAIRVLEKIGGKALIESELPEMEKAVASEKGKQKVQVN